MLFELHPLRSSLLPKRDSYLNTQTFFQLKDIKINKANVFTFALWVGKLPTSRRYNLLPLLRSSPGGFAGSWPYRTYPYTCLKKPRTKDTLLCSGVQRLCQRVKRKTCFSVLQRAQPIFATFAFANVVHFFHLSKHNDKIISSNLIESQKCQSIRITKTLFSLKAFAPIFKNIKLLLLTCNVFLVSSRAL